MKDLLITHLEGKNIDEASLFALYNDAGWKIYTNDLQLLKNAIQNSLYVLTAWDNQKLVGLVRIVGDGLSIIYIQDILVLKDYRRKGIGTRLINEVLKKYSPVRQKVLLTDDTPETRKFYESLNFEACDNGKLIAFVKLTQ